MMKYVLLLLFLPCLAFADINDRADVKTFIQEMVKTHQFSEKSLNHLFEQVDIQESIIEAMTRPAESKPWYIYRPIFVSAKSIDDGVDYFHEHEEALKRAEKEYGVPASIIVAIIGVETRYGRNTGGYRVIDALSTLAFEYPKRAPYFRSELVEYLLLTREKQIDPLTLKGSYAGAMGIPQFMPSSYRKYGVNNLWTNHNDAIASVANYFKNYGWHTGEPVALKLKKVADPSVGLETVELNTTVGALRAQGVRDLNGLNDAWRGIILGYQLPHSKEYWLGLQNFYVITRYNKSPQYALAVYQLGRAVDNAL